MARELRPRRLSAMSMDPLRQGKARDRVTIGAGCLLRDCELCNDRSAHEQPDRDSSQSRVRRSVRASRPGTRLATACTSEFSSVRQRHRAAAILTTYLSGETTVVSWSCVRRHGHLNTTVRTSTARQSATVRSSARGKAVLPCRSASTRRSSRARPSEAALLASSVSAAALHR